MSHFFALNRQKMTNAPCQHSSSLTHCPPHIISQSSALPSPPPPPTTPHTQSPAPPSSPCHVASMHVRSLSISFSRAPLISLCSRMWAERAASPTLKITTSVWQGWGGVPERGVWVWGWVVVGYLQLTGIRFNCSNSTGEGVMGRRLKKSVVYFLQTLDRKYRVPATANAETHFLFHCWGKIGQIRSLMPWCRGAKGDFYLLRFSNRKLKIIITRKI